MTNILPSGITLDMLLAESSVALSYFDYLETFRDLDLSGDSCNYLRYAIGTAFLSLRLAYYADLESTPNGEYFIMLTGGIDDVIREGFGDGWRLLPGCTLHPYDYKIPEFHISVLESLEEFFLEEARSSYSELVPAVEEFIDDLLQEVVLIEEEWWED